MGKPEDPDTVNPRLAALDYHNHGLAVFPLPYGKKRDRRRWTQWGDPPPDALELSLLFTEDTPANIAAICGEPSGNLLCLDADNPQAFDQTRNVLAGLGINTWTMTRPPNGSDHDGGGKAILRTPLPVASTKAGGLDVLAQGRYFTLPPSGHELGGAWSFDTRTPAIFELERLEDLAKLVTLRPAKPRRTRTKIPRLAWNLLTGKPQALAAYADPNTGAVDRSAAEMALVCSLIRAGYTYTDAHTLLLTSSDPGHFQDLIADPSRDAEQYLRFTWRKAHEWLAEHNTEAARLAQEMERWTLSRPWPGRSGSTDRATYLAHLRIVQRCGEDPYHASARDLAELAGVHWRTAAKASRRLAEAGLLKLETPSTATLAHKWSLLKAQGIQELRQSVPTTSIPPHDGVGLYAAHDAFRWAGLNKSGAETLAALQSVERAHVLELARWTGRHRRTVERKMLALYATGLARPLGDGYWQAVEDPDLDEAARMLRTRGKGKAERQKHRRQRRLNRRKLDRGKSNE